MESLSKFSIYEPDDIEEIITTTKHNPSGTIRSWNSEIEKKASQNQTGFLELINLT
jgi:hypothetical protein